MVQNRALYVIILFNKGLYIMFVYLENLWKTHKKWLTVVASVGNVALEGQEWKYTLHSTHLPWFTMELRFDKPIENWKYYKSKMHQNHFVYQIQFSLAYLNHAQIACISLPLGKTIPCKAVRTNSYNKLLNISCNLLNTVQKVKNEIAV